MFITTIPCDISLIWGILFESVSWYAENSHLGALYKAQEKNVRDRTENQVVAKPESVMMLMFLAELPVAW